MGKFHLILCLSLAACAPKSQSQESEETVSPPYSYEESAERALTFQDATGFVITRHEGGQEKHQGDSLLFTGLLVASLDCERGERATQALLDMPPELWRHQILAGQPVSLDGALGFYLAAAWRIKMCDERDRWRPFLEKHKEVGGPDVPLSFGYVRDRLFDEAGVPGPFAANQRIRLEQEVGAWARATVLTKQACYRINLGLIAFETLELLGDMVGGGDFCSATKNVGLPTVDKWCGRNGLGSYISNYKINEYQYRHQRCDWEDADGGGDDGKDEQPGIDYLRALQAYSR